MLKLATVDNADQHIKLTADDFSSSWMGPNDYFLVRPAKTFAINQRATSAGRRLKDGIDRAKLQTMTPKQLTDVYEWDGGGYGVALMQAMVVDWSFTDENGVKIPFSSDKLARLYPEQGDWLLAKLENLDGGLLPEDETVNLPPTKGNPAPEAGFQEATEELPAAG